MGLRCWAVVAWLARNGHSRGCIVHRRRLPACVGSLAKNAPSLDIGKWLPTNGLRLMSGEKPQARESISDPKSDCAPVSAIADTSAVVDATAGPSQMRDIVFGTLGLSCKQVCFHFPLENMWYVGLGGWRPVLSVWNPTIYEFGSESVVWTPGVWGSCCTELATGFTAKKCMVVSSWGRVSEAAVPKFSSGTLE